MMNRHVFILFCLLSCLSPLLFGHEEQQIIVIIPSYNNEKWVGKNLRSIFEQCYSNFQVIYVADCPSDNTVAEVRRVVEQYHQEDRFTLIVNKERCGAMANWYTTIHSCPDDAIIVQVDGDDWLFNDQVLSYVNTIYSERDVWLTYGQFIDYPSNKIGYEYSKPFSEQVIAHNSFRNVEQLPMSHLRTCKAWLFKAIKLEDTLYQEQFYPMTCDKLMLSCMIEMAARHHYRIPDVLYVYNNSNAISDHRVDMTMQHSLAWHILGQKPYPQLQKPLYVEQMDKHDRITAIVLCQRIDTVEAVVDAINQKFHGVQHVAIFVPGTTEKYFDNLPLSVSIHDSTALALNLYDFINRLDDRYLLLLTDQSEISKEIDFVSWMVMLKKTQTKIFYGSLRYSRETQSLFQKKLPLVNRDHTIAAWYSARKNSNWRIPAFDMALWERGLLLDALQASSSSSIESLAHHCDQALMQKNVLGLLPVAP